MNKLCSNIDGLIRSSSFPLSFFLSSAMLLDEHGVVHFRTPQSLAGRPSRVHQHIRMEFRSLDNCQELGME